MRKLLLRLTRKLWNHRIDLTLADAMYDGLISADQRHMLMEMLVLRKNFVMCLCDRHGGNTLTEDICTVGG